LLQQLSPHGFWTDFCTLAGQSDEWCTAYVGAAIGGESTAQMQSACRWLRGRQRHGGGWGYNAVVPPDCDSTAFALLLVSQSESADQAAITWLEQSQKPDGGFSTYPAEDQIRAFTKLPQTFPFSGWCAASNDVTAACAIALFSACGAKTSVLKAWDYLKRFQLPDGSWSSYWWSTDLYPTALAVRLARHLGGDEKIVQAATTWALRQQQTNGSWCDGHSILRDGKAAEAARKWLLASQLSDGSWVSQPILRIPSPDTVWPRSDAKWVEDGLGTSVILRDANRLFTTATVLKALKANVSV
jgi:squalene cyclase